MKYPTPKQVRFHYKNLQKLHARLQLALTAAHHAGVIVYDDAKFADESPCATHWKTDQRIDLTTQKVLARAMREEIMKGI